MHISWDPVFIDSETPFFPDEPNPNRIKVAIAAAIVGWTNCVSGFKPPKSFGRGMIKLSEIVGLGLITPNNMMDLAHEVRRLYPEDGD